MHKYDKNYELFLTLLRNNDIAKDNEIKIVNNFKKIYNIVKEYEEIPVRYDEIITNADIRLEFLMDSVRIVFENQEIDKNVRDVVLQMYDELYDYLYKDSELKEIELPDDLVKNMFDRNMIPDESLIRFIMRLIRENKIIFDSEINGKYFSQMIDCGLHKGITKELKIEEVNLPHLLGLTNDGSLYEFYRKTVLDYRIKQILISLGYDSFQDISFDKDKFNLKFNEAFGLDYSEENCIKIINWRYNATDDYLLKRGIVVTPSERAILNQNYHFAPKSNTLNFYCMPDVVKLLEKENEEIRLFMYEYLRNEIITNMNSKTKNNIFIKDELELLSNFDANDLRVVKLIDKYIEFKKYKFDDDKNFKMKFISKFGYSYPLMNYYELLSKNVGFYNFSLFKNLNSIIVDYDSFGKKIESDAFLASYSYDKIHSIEDMIKVLLDKKDKKYEKAVMQDELDSGLDKKYIMNLRSLLSFPEDDRYYFKYGFVSRDKQKQDDKIIMENAPSAHNITLIGFKEDSDEKIIVKGFELKGKKKFKHFLKCETNITVNYHEYITDFKRYGIEYPLDILDQRSELPYNRKRKILKVVKPLDKLMRYMVMLEEFPPNIDYTEKEIEFIGELKQSIRRIITEYKDMSSIKIHIMRYMLETRTIREEEMYEYSVKFRQERDAIEALTKVLDDYLEHVDELIYNYKNNNKTKR